MKYRILSVSALAGLAACQTAPQPAILTDPSPETVAAVTGVLAAAVDRAEIQLGPGDLTRDSVISVLPPRPGPMEGNSPAVPTIFDIVLMDGDCYVQERASGELFPLTGITCRSTD
ncbi:putative lipoprotein [Hyphomonas neptunium ATCC 15444]|uniref:Putative lipoprotein n=2 Tax=Hyphomonas TaxID=85 RepID=Q0C0K7_HYPNA|nr:MULTISPECIES: hypothetical protein [Hyphomonas]ABI78157.1 putative lipoprotein [Hyphomonas neptunium ATCC 15444]KCZ83994.1 putative lipoprotein [Hyphomonas hirschiana VP5]